MFSSAPGRWLALAFFSLLLALSLGNPVLLAGAVFLLVVVLIGATLVAPRRIAVHRELPRTVCWAGAGLDVRRHLEVGGGVGPVYVNDELPGETQFTPDVLPADIVGSRVWRQNSGEFQWVRGAIFTNVLLADEINRAPPQTQAALLEAMEERQVTIDGETLRLAPPFLVIATQNPIEQEGTYPLPEAQLDRFLFRLATGYPTSRELENEILMRRIQWQKDDPSEDLEPAVDVEGFLQLQRSVELDVYVDQVMVDYITQLVRLTRDDPRVAVGASPRGGLALLKVARSMALIHGRDFVIPNDVKMVVPDVLGHRVILNIEDILEGARAEEVVQDAVDRVPVPTELGHRAPS